MILKWVRLSFLYLLLVGVLGCLLRWIVFAPVEGVNFRYFLHAHSHVAFLGWVFNAFFAALIFAYIPTKAKSYSVLFWLLQVAVLGMLITFPLQGYAAASITFSTAHIFLSYWFAGKFLLDTKNIQNGSVSILFIRWSLFFMVLSSLGPFALGAIMAQGLAGTPLYQLAIYFYLHFQYDGWFSFAAFGLFFWLYETNGITYNKVYAEVFFWLMVAACLPAYTLSTLWTQPNLWVYIVGFISATMQIIALIYLFIIIKNSTKQLQTILLHWTRALLTFSFAAFILKIVLQFASAFPSVADLAYRVRNFTIGYLHIVFIGFITVFLIGWFIHTGLLKINTRTAKTGIIIFLVGFIFSEAIIFLQPLLLMTGFGILPFGHQLLFLISLLMPTGTAMFIFSDQNPVKNRINTH